MREESTEVPAAIDAGRARRRLRGRASLPSKQYRPLGTPDTSLQHQRWWEEKRTDEGAGGRKDAPSPVPVAPSAEDENYERFFKRSAPTVAQRWRLFEQHHRGFNNGYGSIRAQLVAARGRVRDVKAGGQFIELCGESCRPRVPERPRDQAAGKTTSQRDKFSARWSSASPKMQPPSSYRSYVSRKPEVPPLTLPALSELWDDSEDSSNAAPAAKARSGSLSARGSDTRLQPSAVMPDSQAGTIMDPGFQMERLCTDFVKAQHSSVKALDETLRCLESERVETYRRKFPAFLVSSRLGGGGVEADLRAMRLQAEVQRLEQHQANHGQLAWYRRLLKHVVAHGNRQIPQAEQHIINTVKHVLELGHRFDAPLFWDLLLSLTESELKKPETARLCVMLSKELDISPQRYSNFCDSHGMPKPREIYEAVTPEEARTTASHRRNGRGGARFSVTTSSPRFTMTPLYVARWRRKSVSFRHRRDAEQMAAAAALLHSLDSVDEFHSTDESNSNERDRRAAKAMQMGSSKTVPTNSPPRKVSRLVSSKSVTPSPPRRAVTFSARGTPRSSNAAMRHRMSNGSSTARKPRRNSRGAGGGEPHLHRAMVLN